MEETENRKHTQHGPATDLVDHWEALLSLEAGDGAGRDKYA